VGTAQHIVSVAVGSSSSCCLFIRLTTRQNATHAPILPHQRRRHRTPAALRCIRHRATLRFTRARLRGHGAPFCRTTRRLAATRCGAYPACRRCVCRWAAVWAQLPRSSHLFLIHLSPSPQTRGWARRLPYGHALNKQHAHAAFRRGRLPASALHIPVALRCPLYTPLR